MPRPCSFYVKELDKCQNAYCYYETSTTIDCPIKKEVMAKVGPVDPSLKKRALRVPDK